ncbi:hypothetical protein KEM54_001130 [Ascosphaera aggregata]|nr:hypothetical protein KEM54_001130 [Ascosphaera aggregata]
MSASPIDLPVDRFIGKDKVSNHHIGQQLRIHGGCKSTQDRKHHDMMRRGVVVICVQIGVAASVSWSAGFETARPNLYWRQVMKTSFTHLPLYGASKVIDQPNLADPAMLQHEA